jgi:transposase-like protein
VLASGRRFSVNGVDFVADFPALELLATACKSDEEFERSFGTEEACRDWFFRARWPNGFVCPGCRNMGASWQAPRRVWQCVKCHRQTSLTAGTLLERTKKPLRTWFEAAYLIVQRGVNARTLQRELRLTYKTAWSWAHKLREALKGHETPHDPGPRESRRHDAARRSREYVREPDARRRGPCGCSKLLTRDWGFPNEIEEEREAKRDQLWRSWGYRTDPEPVPADAPPTRDLFSSCELQATYSGAVTEKHLRTYLDELAFRLNRRRRPRAEGFLTAMRALAASAPRTYRAIIARPAPEGYPLSIWSLSPPRERGGTRTGHVAQSCPST